MEFPAFAAAIFASHGLPSVPPGTRQPGYIPPKAGQPPAAEIPPL